MFIPGMISTAGHTQCGIHSTYPPWPDRWNGVSFGSIRKRQTLAWWSSWHQEWSKVAALCMASILVVGDSTLLRVHPMSFLLIRSCRVHHFGQPTETLSGREIASFRSGVSSTVVARPIGAQPRPCSVNTGHTSTVPCYNECASAFCPRMWWQNWRSCAFGRQQQP